MLCVDNLIIFYFFDNFLMKPFDKSRFIVHIWRLTRILERGPTPQNGNVIVVVPFFESGP